MNNDSATSGEILDKFSQFDIRVGQITHIKLHDNKKLMVKIDIGNGKSMVVVQKFTNVPEEEIINSKVVVIANIA